MNKGILVKKLSGFPEAKFLVKVAGRTNTEHKVSLSEDYYQKITFGEILPEELIKRTFLFLLEREPNTSILSEFSLSDVNSYYPEFEEVIGKR